MYTEYGYTYNVDYWSLGCTLFKFLTGNIYMTIIIILNYIMVCCSKLQLNIDKPFNYLLKGLLIKLS